MIFFILLNAVGGKEAAIDKGKENVESCRARRDELPRPQRPRFEKKRTNISNLVIYNTILYPPLLEKGAKGPGRGRGLRTTSQMKKRRELRGKETYSPDSISMTDMMKRNYIAPL